MNRVLVAGVVATGLGLGGYAAGIAVVYPGRAFSLTLVMLGLALIAMRRLDETPSPTEGAR